MFIYHENASAQASFTRTGDAYAFNEDLKIAAVADSPLRELLRTKLRRYPQDDHGFDAASTFCNTMVETLSRQEKLDLDSFRDALVQANQRVKELNVSLGRTSKDYLHYDLAETVGVAAIQVGSKLIYGGVEDCYVFVKRSPEFDGVAPFQYQITRAGKYVEKVTQAGAYLNEFPSALTDALPSDALWEPVWCNVLRNNSEITDEAGQKVGWGCFTGEVEAEDFFQVHELELLPGDHIFVLSDGMISILNNKDFLRWFIENVENTFKFSADVRKKIVEMLGEEKAFKEKTFIYWEA